MRARQRAPLQRQHLHPPRRLLRSRILPRRRKVQLLPSPLLPERPHPFTVSGGGRTLGVEFVEGYTYAQAFAPAGYDLICFEPMTAPANALISHDGLRLAAPGEPFHAAFRITVDG